MLLEYLGARGTEAAAFASSNLVVHKILQPISGRVSDLSPRPSRSLPLERF